MTQECFEEIFSLTPGFSRVRGAREEKNRLIGFSWVRPWFTALKRVVVDMRHLQKCRKIVGQASSLSSFLGKTHHSDRQDACPTKFCKGPHISSAGQPINFPPDRESLSARLTIASRLS
jgi:hypothetical protein